MRKAQIGSILQLCSIILVFYFMIVLNSAQPADAAQIPKRVIERIETPEIDGGVSEHVRYEYNDANQLIREIYEFQSRNGEKEQDSCPITYDYYQNGMLRTKRYNCLQYNEFHYDSYGHFMDCDTGAIDPEGVFIGTDPSKVSREYDKQGNLIRFQLDDEVDPVIREYQYDEQNRISKVSEKKEHQVSFTSGIVNVIQTENVF